MPKPRKTAMEYAVLLLGIRAYSTADLKKKMLDREYPAAEVKAVLEECVKRGFLNDELFAEALTENLYSRGSGKRKVYQKLRQKGIDSELIKQTLEENTDPRSMTEQEAANQALARRMNSLLREEDIRKRKEKALRFLAGRGFSAGVSYAALRHCFSKENQNFPEFDDGTRES